MLDQNIPLPCSTPSNGGTHTYGTWAGWEIFRALAANRSASCWDLYPDLAIANLG
jgi:hypothetical protein